MSTDTPIVVPDTVPDAVERERTYRWQDPVELAAAGTAMSGLDFLTAYLEGRIPAPPGLITGGIKPIEFSDGRAVFELTPAEWQYNPLGSVHGGILAMLADSALGCAVHTKLPVGTGYTSLEVKINFTRAVTVASGTLTCEGAVVTFGRRIATSEARISDATGRIVAHASSTLLIIGSQ
jgi:uncharacterized protein (TIGR00369 family)